MAADVALKEADRLLPVSTYTKLDTGHGTARALPSRLSVCQMAATVNPTFDAHGYHPFKDVFIIMMPSPRDISPRPSNMTEIVMNNIQSHILSIRDTSFQRFT